MRSRSTLRPTTFDSQGRPYNASNSNPMTSVKVVTYVASQGGTATLAPDGNLLDGPRLPRPGTGPPNLTVVGVDSTLTWSVPAPPAIGTVQAVATTTTLAAVASGANLVLNATVAPTAAGRLGGHSGRARRSSVRPRSAGGLASRTVLAPTPGVHAYSASFVPTDPNAFVASDAAPQSWTIAAGTGGITVTLTVSCRGPDGARQSDARGPGERHCCARRCARHRQTPA